MAKAAGRRPEETSELSPRQGPETWALALIAGLMLLAVVALLIFAGI